MTQLDTDPYPVEEVSQVPSKRVGTQFQCKKSGRYMYYYQMGKKHFHLFRPNSVIEFCCKAYEMNMPTETLESFLFRYTNCCVYHLGGVCIHPECQYNHSEELRGLMKAYYE